ncbi:MAG: hypothetical protein M1836_003062 [Candelina mexicana]|nr:MAG: hypothetical protein M1836_003062 [Candelina mexicana]
MSGPLVHSDSGGGFAQQGQVDWVAFSDHTINFSIKVIARLSKAGIEPLTIVIGRAIGHRFILPADTQRRLDEALSGLETFPTLSKVLSFGFGIRHIVDSLRDTEQGAALVVLCASLGAFYPTFFCARVLQQLCKVSETPQELTPALSQWMRLVEACSGILAKTKFPLLVQGLQRSIIPRTDDTCHTGDLPTDAEALSKALMMGAQFTGGGLDCAWIAGLAQWMLGLTVNIIDESGKVIYQGSMLPSQHSSTREPQVSILLPKKDLSQQSTAPLILQHKMLKLPQGKKIFLWDRCEYGPKEGYVNRLSTWSHILDDTFGSTFRALLKTGSYFGQLLAAVSLLAEQAEYSEQRSPPNTLSSPWDHPLWIHKQSKGRAFLHFAAEQLPELQPCVKYALCADPQNECTGHDYGYADAIRKLHAICICHNCRSDSGRKHPRSLGLDGRHGYMFDERGTDICLQALAEAIICYLWLLAPATIDKDILPSTLGLSQLFYLLHRVRFAEHGSMIYLSFQGVSARRGMTYGNQTFDRLPDVTWLNQIPALFRALTGLPLPLGTRYDASAIAANGLCIYYKAFYQIDCPPHAVCSISVIPGHIVHNNGIFRKIADLPLEWLEESRSVQDPHTNDNASTSLNLIWDLVVRETEHSDLLEAAIAFRDVSLERLEWLPFYRFTRLVRTCLSQMDCKGCKPEQSITGAQGKYQLSVTRSSVEGSSASATECRPLPGVDYPWTLVRRGKNWKTMLDLEVCCLAGPQLYFQLIASHKNLERTLDLEVLFTFKYPILAECCGCFRCVVESMVIRLMGCEERWDNLQLRRSGKFTFHPLEGPPSPVDFELELKPEGVPSEQKSPSPMEHVANPKISGDPSQAPQAEPEP